MTFSLFGAENQYKDWKCSKCWTEKITCNGLPPGGKVFLVMGRNGCFCCLMNPDLPQQKLVLGSSHYLRQGDGKGGGDKQLEWGQNFNAQLQIGGIWDRHLSAISERLKTIAKICAATDAALIFSHTLSQIYPHWDWNSKLNTKLRLEFHVEYGFKLELQVE